MAMLLETNLNYEKCGEILTAINVEQRVFALKCFFCENYCSTLADFISHIEQKHGYLLSATATATFTKKEQVGDLDFCDWDGEYNGNIENLEVNIKVENDYDEDNPVIEGDPLNDSTTAVKPTKTEIKKQTNLLLKPKTIKAEIKDDSDHDDADRTNDISDSDSDYIATEESEDSEKDDNDNLEFDMALVSAYEAMPMLWDKTITDGRVRLKRKQAQKKFTDELSEKFKKQLKWTNLDKRIKVLRKKYSNELVKARTKGKDFEPSWLFSKLDFLKNTLQVMKKVNRSTADKQSSHISNEQHLKIIEIYEKYPCLWNTEHIGYRSKFQRESAVKEMLTLLKENAELDITDDDLQKRLYRIRLACSKEKIRQQDYKDLEDYEPLCKTFDKLKYLIDHVQPFKCPTCSETFKSADQFKIHKSKHDGTMPFNCPICQKGFTSVANVTLHVRRHTHDYPFVCEVCEKGFATSNELSIHSRQHTGEKPYFCETCGKSFRTRSSFCRHKLRHEKRPIHFCKLCKKGFYEKTRLDEHMNAHFNVRNKVCKICGKTFTSLKNLWQHKLIHSGKRKYVCKLCGKDFVQNAGLNKHLKSHETATSRVNKITNKALEDEKKKFPCEHCNKRFAQKIRRKIHMKNVHNIVVEEPGIEKNKFTCDHCGKKFNFNAGLQKHLRVHEPKLPKMEDLKRKRLPAEKNLKCEICFKKYAHEKRLNRHMQKSHQGLLELHEINPVAERPVWFYPNSLN